MISEKNKNYNVAKEASQEDINRSVKKHKCGCFGPANSHCIDQKSRQNSHETWNEMIGIYSLLLLNCNLFWSLSYTTIKKSTTERNPLHTVPKIPFCPRNKTIFRVTYFLQIRVGWVLQTHSFIQVFCENQFSGQKLDF